MNRFIAIEGVDFVGKTTVCQEVSKQLDFIYVKTPPKDYSPMRPFFDDIPPRPAMSRFFFYCASIYESSNEIKQILESGKNVVADRYLHSLQIYHEELTGTDLSQYINNIGFLKPNLVLVLYADDKNMSERRQKRKNLSSDIKLENNELLMQKIANHYHTLIDSPALQKVDTSNKNIDEVVQECIMKIKAQ